MSDFEQRLATFVAGAQKIIDANHAKMGGKLAVPQLEIDRLRRYIRIVRIDGPGRSVHCFIDPENGSVLKAAGWKAPAKHARGNLYDEANGLGGMSPYGAAYMR